MFRKLSGLMRMGSKGLWGWVLLFKRTVGGREERRDTGRERGREGGVRLDCDGLD